MKLKKLTQQIEDFFDTKKSQRNAKAKALKQVISQLKDKEKSLKKEIEQEKDKGKREKLERKASLAHSQRKKGLLALKELKK